jgi:hypothetical protein
MNAPIVLEQEWLAQVKELLHGVHGHQKKTFALFALGIALVSMCSATTSGRNVTLDMRSVKPKWRASSED